MGIMGEIKAKENRTDRWGSAALLASIELRHLRYVEAAARYGSFRKAAEALHLQQSNLSRRIRDLEERLGAPLFERSSAGVQLTPAGQEFLSGARRVLHELANIVEAAHAVGARNSGQLTIGLHAPLSGAKLRAALIAYKRRFPQVDLNPIERTSLSLLHGVGNGTVDIAIIPGVKPASASRSMVLWSERILVVLPESHALAEKRTLSWADLQDECFLMSGRDPRTEIEDLLVRKLTATGKSPNVVRHDVSHECIKSLVAAGQGISLVSEANDCTNCVGVAYRALHDVGEFTEIRYLAQWRDGNHNPALRSFIQTLAEVYRPPAQSDRTPPA